MASSLMEPLKKVTHHISSYDDKIASLQHNMIAPDSESRITTDSGVRQHKTEEWLKVVREDQVGPALLEDAFGREKVEKTKKLSRRGGY